MEHQQPHVVVHPLPVQGHIKPLLCLAQLLSEAGLYVSFVITHYTHKRLENLSALTTQFPNLHFEPFSDGLPDDHPRCLNFDFFVDIKTKTKPFFKDLLLSLDTKSEKGLSPPVTCVINDGYLSYPLDVAEELKIPLFTFIAHGACFLLTYYSIPKLIEEGHIPFSDDNMNLEINGIAGLEGVLRRKNLPPACMMKEVTSPLFRQYLDETLAMNRASGLIINTFDDLEVQCLPHLANNFSKVYSIGPLHVFLNSKIGNRSHLIASHASLWKVEQNCIAWLDSQPLKSVVYVSFGTLAKRQTIKSAIRAVMNGRKEEFQNSIDKIAKCGLNGIGHGGSSNQNLEFLVEDIKKIKSLE
ncbi:hypothetical protein FEM48_Zijuj11G0101100 [Ziziphus jujuba var. spinosa]|uniref:Uncharacterized protein n=1 Tax=Ziziphus jujuba var. spinosa TaxID=714518 RepID=A0A978UIB7_ZIZJJ|nr:hypothetical protein FEM48_Zijuj11G0101100 [Ziziphus jujuba var. spinosa]